MTTNRIFSLLKAILFTALGGFAIYLYFTTEGKAWQIIGALLSAFLAFNYIRQAFDRYHR